MRVILAGFFLIFSSVAAEDAWSKVKALKSGTEIRGFPAGIKEPLVGEIDEAIEEGTVLVLKNEQKDSGFLSYGSKPGFELVCRKDMK